MNLPTVALIYAYWPNQPFGVTWCDLPWAIRSAGLPERLTKAGHQVVESVLMVEDESPEELRAGFRLAGQIAEEVRKARAAGELPVILCGSCALAAVGGVAGLGADCGIVWLDAHPDMNTPETTTSALLEGMALAVATGTAWRAMAREHAGLEPASLGRTVLVGARDIERAEAETLLSAGVPETKEAGVVLARLAGAQQVYVHLDMDVHDALAVRSNAFAVEDGPDVATVREILTAIDGLGALAVTGLDPQAEDAERALEIAIEHIAAVAAGWRGE
ncbi:MAG: arginase family protein [Rhizobiales bacterium]|nr:arginase family protein [Hyphomicrobiales bacterium]